MPTFGIFMNFSGTYLEEIFKPCIDHSIESGYDDIKYYSIDFYVREDTLCYESNNITILMDFDKDDILDKDFFEELTGIYIKAIKNDIVFIDTLFQGRSLGKLLNGLAKFERKIHECFIKYSDIKESEMYINCVSSYHGLGNSEKYELDTIEAIMDGLESVFQGTYPDADAYRGIPIVRTKSAR